MRYDWDEAKRDANLAKHGVDFADAEDFEWERAIEVPDDRRDYGEPRWIALGPIRARLHVLIYTRRGRRVRIISLRRANIRERKFYEAQT